MSKIKRPANKPGISKNQTYCNSAKSQRQRILQYLLEGKSLTTIEARDLLDVLHPGGRIMELRQQKHNIRTHWTTIETGFGKHRVAKYVLLSGKWQGGKKC